MNVDIGITVYAKPLRLARLLETLKFTECGALAATQPPIHIAVFEDPSNEENAAVYSRMCERGRLDYMRAPQWGCMQGIIQYAMEQTRGDWFLYLPDDVLPTPRSIGWVLRWLEVLPDHVGAVQVPYWNYKDIVQQVRGREFLSTRQLLHEGVPHNALLETMLDGPLDWLAQVPLNPHWIGPAFYLNVNGAGFALRRKAWEVAGGFSQKTWCLDEDISCKIWLHTEYTIVCVPGPPWVHQGGASTPQIFEFGHAHDRKHQIEGWLDAWGVDKDTLSARCRQVMEERSKQYGWPVR